MGHRHDRHAHGACIAADPEAGSAGARANYRATFPGLAAMKCGDGDTVDARTPCGIEAASPLALAWLGDGGGFGGGPETGVRGGPGDGNAGRVTAVWAAAVSVALPSRQALTGPVR